MLVFFFLLPTALLIARSAGEERRKNVYLPLAISAAALYFVTTSVCQRAFVWRRVGVVDWGEKGELEGGFFREGREQRASRERRRVGDRDSIDGSMKRERQRERRPLSQFLRSVLFSFGSTDLRTLERSSSVSEALELLSEDMAAFGFLCYLFLSRRGGSCQLSFSAEK